MIKKLTMALAMALCLSASVHAQEVTLEGLSARSFTGVQSINGEFYYTFYFGEKTKTKGMANFVLAMFDADLKPLNTTEIEIPKDSRLSASAFNGSYFMFIFADLAHKKRTMVTLDKTGNIIKNVIEEDVRRGLLTPENTPDIHGLSTGEFLVVTPEREKKYGYEIALVDKDLNTKWTKSYFPEKGSWSIEDSRLTPNNLFLLRKGKEALIGDKYTYAVQKINLATGDADYTTDIKDEDDGGFPSFITVNSEGKVATGGMYFKNGKYDEKNSDGLFFALLNNDGSFAKMSKTSWKKVKEQIRGEYSSLLVGGKTKVLVQDVIQKKDGGYVVITETFRKGAADETGAGALSKFAGMNSTKTESGDKGFTVMDFAFFNFDANGELTGIDKVEKATKEAIVKGSLANESGLEMAQELHQRKFFCYRNTIEVNGKQYIMYKNLDGYKTKAYFLPVGATSTAGIGSVDMDKWLDESVNKLGKLGKMMGSGPKATFESDDYAIGDNNPELYRNIIPAKPGYVLLYQFFNGKMSIWLEPIPAS